MQTPALFYIGLWCSLLLAHMPVIDICGWKTFKCKFKCRLLNLNSNLGVGLRSCGNIFGPSWGSSKENDQHVKMKHCARIRSLVVHTVPNRNKAVTQLNKLEFKVLHTNFTSSVTWGWVVNDNIFIFGVNQYWKLTAEIAVLAACLDC